MFNAADIAAVEDLLVTTSVIYESESLNVHNVIKGFGLQEVSEKSPPAMARSRFRPITDHLPLSIQRYS